MVPGGNDSYALLTFWVSLKRSAPVTFGSHRRQFWIKATGFPGAGAAAIPARPGVPVPPSIDRTLQRREARRLPQGRHPCCGLLPPRPLRRGAAVPLRAARERHHQDRARATIRDDIVGDSLFSSNLFFLRAVCSDGQPKLLSDTTAAIVVILAAGDVAEPLQSPATRAAALFPLPPLHALVRLTGQYASRGG